MAVLVCKTCGRRFSSIARKCPRCGTDPDAERKMRGRHPGIGPYVHYMLAMVVAVIGAGWLYNAVASGDDPAYAKWMVGAGLAWYVAARIWGIMRRR